MLHAKPHSPERRSSSNRSMRRARGERPKMGRIRRVFEVWCDCAQWAALIGSTKSDAERAARGLGWSKTKKTGWTCPSCKEKR